MPSIKMKSKSTPKYLKEKCGLHVCKKSSMISKSPLSHARIIDNADDVGSPIQTNEVEAPEVEKQSPPKEIPATCETESATSPSLSSMDTTFSPIYGLIDDPNDLLFYDDRGSNDLYVPQLESEDSDDNSKCPCKYISGLPLESIYSDDNTENNFVHDYKWNAEPSTFFDMTNDFMAIPSLEDAASVGYALDNKSFGETLITSSESSFDQAIHQLKPCVQESDIDYTTDFDPHMFIKSMPELPILVSSQMRKDKSVTLVLDLDETLVHSTLESYEDADFTFSVHFNMQDHTVYVKRRPHLSTFLERVAEMFEIVIFTASESIYAKQLLDVLDPEGKLISRRAYRESCTFLDGTYTKDLTVLGIDLAKVVIIDNSPQVFRLQVNNGIPIKSWFNDPSDSALLSLLPFLETLANVDDVRPVIAERFGKKEYELLVYP